MQDPRAAVYAVAEQVLGGKVRDNTLIAYHREAIGLGVGIRTGLRLILESDPALTVGGLIEKLKEAKPG